MAAVSAPQPGAIAGAYRNTGTRDSPTWAEMTSVSGGDLGDNWDFGEASTRASGAKAFDKTMVDLTSTLQVLANPAATDYIALYSASQIRTGVIDMMLLNAKISVEGAIGIRAAFKLKRSENQDMGGIISNTFELKPYIGGASPVTPKTVVMGASSAPTFTDL